MSAVPTDTPTPGFVPIREFASIQEGYDAVRAAAAPFPFIVRDTLEFRDITLANIRRQIKFEQQVYGYAKYDDSTMRLSGIEALSQFDNDVIGFSIVDSPASRGYSSLLPQPMPTLAASSGIPTTVWLAYVLSLPSASCGTLHTDPSFGSNWQWLAEGCKTWYALDDANFSLADYNSHQRSLLSTATTIPTPQVVDVNTPTEHATESIARTSSDPVPTTVTSLAECAPLPAPNMEEISQHQTVYRATIGANAFISCPMGWPHAVLTSSKSSGLSGYSETPQLFCRFAQLAIHTTTTPGPPEITLH
jgi:hypothetical protein